MTAPEPLRAEHRALILKAFIGEAEKAVTDLTGEFGASYPLPTSVTFESPLDGARLGRVTRNRTSPEWRVVSREQLVEHITREFPNVLETVYLVEVPGVDGPVALPEDHPLTQALLTAAPELLTPTLRVPDSVIEAAVQESRDTGQPAAPGIQLVRPRAAALVVAPDKQEGPAAIRRLLASGRVSWSELVPNSMLALPAGGEQPGDAA